MLDGVLSSARRTSIIAYFDIVDGRVESDLMSLFTEDFQFWFPKYGLSKGPAGLGAFAGDFSQVVSSMHHDTGAFTWTESENRVVVEGTTSGVTADGVSWKGGETQGGRFCSVFEFEGPLISRMFIYVDPDYGSADSARYPWPIDDSRVY